MSARKKLSGQSALAVTSGDGWSKPLRGPSCPVASDGPDVVLDADVEAGPMWDDVTRASSGERK
jgi:hypothetical protein